MDTLMLLLTAIGLGVLIAAVPGAIMAEAVRLGLSRGFRPAVSIELGASAGDAVWAVIALVGLAVLVQDAATRLALGVLGSAFLLYLAWVSIRDSRKSRAEIAEKGLSDRGAFLTGAFVSLASPFQVAFWLGIGASTLVLVAAEPQPIHYVTFFVGYMTGSVLWGIGFSALVSYGRRFVSDRLFRATNVLCGVFLAYLAISLLWNTLWGG